MFMIREVIHCRPGQVRALVDKFKALNQVIEGKGYTGFRIYTDVSGERFWTVVLESEHESMDGSKQMEADVMSDPAAQQVMAGYHDLVIEGRTGDLFGRV